MNIKVISTKSDIDGINNESFIHIAFRPSNDDILKIVSKCTVDKICSLGAIQVPRSYFANISQSIRKYLEMQDIRLIQGDVWGHRKDLKEYYTINPRVMENIKELKQKGTLEDDIINTVMWTHHFQKGLAEYVVQSVLI